MSIDLLDRAKAKTGSDYATAKMLGRGRSFISSLRVGDRPMPDWVAYKLAEICGDDPFAALLQNKLQTAKDDEERAVWFRCAQRMEQTAGVVLISETKTPAVRPAIANHIGRREGTRTPDPYHVKVVL